MVEMWNAIKLQQKKSNGKIVKMPFENSFVDVQSIVVTE